MVEKAEVTARRSIVMRIDSLERLFSEQLKDAYSAERQLARALPKMTKAVTHPELHSALDAYRLQTELHMERLECVFDELGQDPKCKRCRAMEGLIDESNVLMREDIDADVLDAGIISMAQRIEHYEIAAYGSLRTYSELLGKTLATRLLQESLGEKMATDRTLARLAEQSINLDAIGDVRSGTGT